MDKYEKLSVVRIKYNRWLVIMLIKYNILIYLRVLLYYEYCKNYIYNISQFVFYSFKLN